MADGAVEFLTRNRAAVMRARVDRTTAEVVRALTELGVRAPIVLKGPVISSWLYGPDSTRTYSDGDLLVEPAAIAEAEACLESLGFAREIDEWFGPPSWRQAAHAWVRNDGGAVDLHWTLPGVGVDPETASAILFEATERMIVDDTSVEVLGVAARALHVALHAAQHGTEAASPIEDLERALVKLDMATWEAALSVAERLDAVHNFAIGLRLHPDGARVAAELRLPASRSAEAELMTPDAVAGAVTLERLATAPTTAARLRFAFRKVIPTREFVRFWFPRARGSRFWTAVAYLWRPIWVALKLPRALVTWLRARR